MSLKFLQVEQNKLINWLQGGKDIIFNRKNSTNVVFIVIVKEGYIYVFTSSEIAILKKFEKSL